MRVLLPSSTLPRDEAQQALALVLVQVLVDVGGDQVGGLGHEVGSMQ